MIRFISSEGRRRCQKGPFPDVRNLAGGFVNARSGRHRFVLRAGWCVIHFEHLMFGVRFTNVQVVGRWGGR